jgi:hypothetical protein
MSSFIQQHSKTARIAVIWQDSTLPLDKKHWALDHEGMTASDLRCALLAVARNRKELREVRQHVYDFADYLHNTAMQIDVKRLARAR